MTDILAGRVEDGGDAPVCYESGRQAKYIADFRYRNKEGEVIVEDVKGMDTPQSDRDVA